MSTVNSEIIKLRNEKVIIEKKIDDKGNHSYWGDSKTQFKKDGDPKKVRLPGTTTIIGACIDKSTPLLIWQSRVIVNFLKENPKRLKEDLNQILEEAKTKAEEEKNISAEIGRAIHQWIEDYIKGDDFKMPKDKKVLQGVNAFLTWKEENEVEFLESETVVYDEETGVCGIADIIIKFKRAGIRKKIKALFDVKTGNAIYNSALAQTGNYTVSYNQEVSKKDAIDERVILRLSKDNEEEYKERMMKKPCFQNNPDKIPEYELFEVVYLDEEENYIDRDYEAFRSMHVNYKWQAESTKRLKK